MATESREGQIFYSGEIEFNQYIEADLHAGILRLEDMFRGGNFDAVVLPRRSAPVLFTAWRAYCEQQGLPVPPALEVGINRDFFSALERETGITTDDIGTYGDVDHDDYSAILSRFPPAQEITRHIEQSLPPNASAILVADDDVFTGSTGRTAEALILAAGTLRGYRFTTGFETFLKRGNLWTELILQLTDKIPGYVPGRNVELYQAIGNILKGDPIPEIALEYFRQEDLAALHSRLLELLDSAGRRL